MVVNSKCIILKLPSVFHQLCAPQIGKVCQNFVACILVSKVINRVYLPMQGTSPSSRTFPSFLARWATHFQLCLAWS